MAEVTRPGIVQGIPVSGPPPQFETRIPPYGVWSTGLCDCLDDLENCCTTFWCPCITFGRIADILSQGVHPSGLSSGMYCLFACLLGCPCCLSCFYRMILRATYLLPESPCPDFLVHCCCESCALCMEYRELKNRGFDMKIGWNANVERQTLGVTAPPEIHLGMFH